jgi:hypothetical protein
MAIFPHLELEDIVQTNDKTRLSATKTFISKDEAAVTLVEIEPESGAGFIDVTGSKQADWYLDWEYSTGGVKTVSVRVTTDGAPVTETQTLQSLTLVQDKQFCTDQNLVSNEHDILKWVRPGRNTHKDVIRRAKAMIMKDLEEFGVLDSEGNKLTEDAIVDIEEVREWATYLALHVIYKTSSNANEDVFKAKAADYFNKAKQSRTRSFFKFDYNGDGSIDKNEWINLQAIEVYRT